MRKFLTLVLLCGMISMGSGCAGLSEMSEADVNKIKQLSDVARSFGPRGRAELRVGRPFIAGLVEGVIVIPGFEADLAAEGDSADAFEPAFPEASTTK